MKLVVNASMSDANKARFISCFPASWNIVFTSTATIRAELPDADALIPEHIEISSELLDLAPRLRMIHTGVGYNNVNLEECRKRGIVVCNSAGINADAVAEHTLAFILAWYKNITLLDSYCKSRSAGPVPEYCGAELSAKTIGIIGLGTIGKKVARLCQAFGMRVMAWNRRPVDIPGVILTDIDTIYRESDIISVHVPLTDSTRGMMNRAVFEKMKKDSLFINTSRGGVVNEADLVEALETHAIGGACLDVYVTEPLTADNPLRALPNTILTPHTAGLPDGKGFHEKRCRFFAANIGKFFAGGEPENIVS